MNRSEYGYIISRIALLPGLSSLTLAGIRAGDDRFHPPYHDLSQWLLGDLAFLKHGFLLDQHKAQLRRQYKTSTAGSCNDVMIRQQIAQAIAYRCGDSTG